MKIIYIASFGHVFPDSYPQVPKNKTLQYVYDVRGLIEDPGKEFWQPGTDQEVADFILTQKEIDNFISMQKPHIEQLLKTGGRFRGINLYYGCAGGYQRSVAIVEALFAWLQKNFDSKYTITKEHLTLDLCAKTYKKKMSRLKADWEKKQTP